jgi:hypothetical protein
MSLSGNSIVQAVQKFLGYPYVYGGTTPSGFDCSGLVQYVLTGLGVSGVPRTSEEQYAWAQHINSTQLAPGDLVFAQFPGDNASPGHVGIYIGNGNIISAEDPAQGVGVSSVSSWGSAIVGYGRVPDSSVGSQSATLDSSESLIPNPLGILSSLSGLVSSLQEIASVFKDIDTIVMDVLNPAFWLRIVSFIAGVLLLIAGIWCLVHASDNSPIVPQNLPMVIPA